MENRKELIRQLESFHPFNEQEETDREVILKHLREDEDVFERKNLSAHITSSAWVTNPGKDRILMAYHNLYDSWSWLGGHNDGEEDCLSVAMREVREESGIENLKPLSRGIFSLECLTVDGHEKNGKYVNSHLHLNITYLLEADDTEVARPKEDENKAVGWFLPEEAVSVSSEKWFRERIYAKLNAKLKKFKEK